MKAIDDARVTTVQKLGGIGLRVRYACGHRIVLRGRPGGGCFPAQDVPFPYGPTAVAIAHHASADPSATTLLLRGHPNCPACAPAVAKPPVAAVERPDAFVAPVVLPLRDWEYRVRRATGAWLAQYRFEDGRWCVVVGIGPGDLYSWNHRTWFGARAAIQTELGLPADRVDAVAISAFASPVPPRCGVLMRDWEALYGPRIADIDPPRSDTPVHEQALERLRNATPEYILDLTVKAGVHTKDGRLTKEYGGKG